MEGYSHEDARRDIDLFFSIRWDDQQRQLERDNALENALYKHLTVGTNVEKYNVACRECWDYYQEQKRKYEGG